MNTRRTQPMRVSSQRPQTPALNAAQKGAPAYGPTAHENRREAMAKRSNRNQGNQGQSQDTRAYPTGWSQSPAGQALAPQPGMAANLTNNSRKIARTKLNAIQANLGDAAAKQEALRATVAAGGVARPNRTAALAERSQYLAQKAQTVNAALEAPHWSHAAAADYHRARAEYHDAAHQEQAQPPPDPRPPTPPRTVAEGVPAQQRSGLRPNPLSTMPAVRRGMRR